MASNVLGFAICFGLSSELATLAAQAVTGAKDPRRAGEFLQRGILINLVPALPISAVWYFTEPILVAAGQDRELARMAGRYIRVLWIAMPPMLVSNCAFKFLAAQGITRVQLLVSLAVLPMNVGLGYTLRHADTQLRIGFLGTAAASAACEWITMLLTILYIWRVNGHQCWTPWSRNALRGWSAYMKLGLPGMVTLVAEWSMFSSSSHWSPV
ncbi:ethionine resistance protein [Blastocladiella emersonii ATCC 22665]|nr:ethionine resistance protein [Blastocladiella emersonii ATCC 22665]